MTAVKNDQSEKVIKKRNRRSVDEIIIDLEKKLERAKMQKAKANTQHLAKIGMRAIEIIGESLPTSEEEAEKIINVLEGIVSGK
jgi:hypothetical protein